MKLLDLVDKLWSDAEIAVLDWQNDIPDTIDEICQSALYCGKSSQIPWEDFTHSYVYSVGTVDDIIVIEVVPGF